MMRVFQSATSATSTTTDPVGKCIVRTATGKGVPLVFCKVPARPITQFRGVGVGQAYYECGEVGHYKRNCSKVGNVGGVGRVLAIGHEQGVADPIVVTGTFLLNNTYACILFDSGAERSFMNQKFAHILK